MRSKFFQKVNFLASGTLAVSTFWTGHTVLANTNEYAAYIPQAEQAEYIFENGWFYDGNGTLTIDSNEAMRNDFVPFLDDNRPWAAFKDVIHKICIGSNVTNISEYAFAYCRNLTEIDFENNSRLEKIGKFAFEGCINLRNVIIPRHVTNIGESAFDRCCVLSNVTFLNNNSAIEISLNAFNNTNLSNNKISEILDHNPTSGEGWTYDKNNKILTIKSNIATQNVVTESIFGGRICPWAAFKNQIRKIEIENNVSKIGNVFEGHKNLNNVVFKDVSKLKTIGTDAFSCCKSLKNIVVPASVTEIGNFAFSGCTNLKTLELKKIPNSVGSHIFGSKGLFGNGVCDKLEKIIVPDDTTVDKLPSNLKQYSNLMCFKTSGKKLISY